MSHLVGLPALQDLAAQYAECEKCEALCQSRTQVVFGGGSSRADILVVAEAPGEHEDEMGVPLVGPSGRLFMDLLANVWLPDERMDRIRAIEPLDGSADPEFDYFEALRDYLDDYIFWCNVVLCRPEENRQPTLTELKSCLERLHRTIYAVDPVLIIALGKTASQLLVGKNLEIMRKRGTIFDIGIKSPATGKPVRYPMMAILHPSYLLRKGDQMLVEKKKGDTYATMQDLKYALSLVDMEYQDLYKTNFPHRPEIQ